LIYRKASAVTLQHLRYQDIFSKALEYASLTREEALQLMTIPLHSEVCYQLMATADRMSKEQFGLKGENHYHIGLNVEPCPLDCLFCSLTYTAGIFTEKTEFSLEQVITWAKEAERHQADALNLMTTGTYPFEKLLEIGRILRREVSTPLVANTRDINHREGEELLKAGFVGAYHAVRLGEGRDTPLNRDKRIATIKVLRDVGLGWANCIEPVGPEHSAEEMVELMLLARDNKASYSGVMRRINFPGSPMEKFGMITELEMARLVAISRLIMGNVPQAHCTHEPHAASLMAGANLFFPEVGSSPRDGIDDTGKGRGHGIETCQQIQREMNLDPLLSSNCYRLPAAGTGHRVQG
jgi:biotin synthase